MGSDPPAGPCAPAGLPSARPTGPLDWENWGTAGCTRYPGGIGGPWGAGGPGAQGRTPSSPRLLLPTIPIPGTPLHPLVPPHPWGAPGEPEGASRRACPSPVTSRGRRLGDQMLPSASGAFARICRGCRGAGAQLLHGTGRGDSPLPTRHGRRHVPAGFWARGTELGPTPVTPFVPPLSRAPATKPISPGERLAEAARLLCAAELTQDNRRPHRELGAQLRQHKPPHTILELPPPKRGPETPGTPKKGLPLLLDPAWGRWGQDCAWCRGW